MERRTRRSIVAVGVSALMMVGGMASAKTASDLQQIKSGPTATVYIERATIVRKAAAATVWSLWDHPQEQINMHEENYRSARLHSEYNCKDRTVKLLEIVEYAGPLATGNTIRSYPASDSEPRQVPPAPLATRY